MTQQVTQYDIYLKYNSPAPLVVGSSKRPLKKAHRSHHLENEPRKERRESVGFGM